MFPEDFDAYVETDEIREYNRKMRILAGACPDCSELCEPWDEDGVSCGYDPSRYISQPLSRVIGDGQ